VKEFFKNYDKHSHKKAYYLPEILEKHGKRKFIIIKKISPE